MSTSGGDFSARTPVSRPIMAGDYADSAAEQAKTLRFERRFRARAHVELAVDLLHVVGNRVAGEAELHADLRQGETLGYAKQHFALALGQLHVGHDRRRGPGLRGKVGDDPASDGRRQRRLALAD